MFSSLLLSFSLVLTQESAAFGKPTVRFEYDTGAEWWTVKVRNYSAVKLLDRIATLTARSIEGREFLEGAPLITVDLDRRSLDQVLEFALGSVDLRQAHGCVGIFSQLVFYKGIDPKLQYHHFYNSQFASFGYN